MNMRYSQKGGVAAAGAAALMLMTVTAGSAPAAVLFQDTFSYSDGNLVGQGPWIVKSTANPSHPINVSGNKAALAGAGDDVQAAISPIISFDPVQNPAVASGFSFYEAADVTVTTARSGDYVFHTSGGPTSSSFQGRLYVQSSGAGFVFGVGVTSETPAYGSDVLNLGQAYRVVLRYDVVPGGNNDAVRLYVDPAGEIEPSAFYVSKTQVATSGDASALGAVNLRQGANATGPDVTVDDLVIADTFASAAAVPEPSSAAIVMTAAACALGLRRRRRIASETA
jgi:hypothetical protein